MPKQNWEELKEKKVIAQWKDLQSYIDKIRLETEQEVKDKILKIIEKERIKIRCAACDGAKCGHTLGCLAIKEITDLINKF